MVDRVLIFNRYSLFLLMIVFLPTLGFAGGADLRNVSWGMSRFEVMASEGDAPEFFDDPDIYYTPDVAGRTQHLSYGFIDDKLVEAVYIITTLKRDDFHRYMKIMEKKYGKPMESRKGGKGGYRFFWDNGTTEITLKPGRLSECRIEYISKKYKYLIEAVARDRAARAERELLWPF